MAKDLAYVPESAEVNTTPKAAKRQPVRPPEDETVHADQTGDEDVAAKVETEEPEVIELASLSAELTEGSAKAGGAEISEAHDADEDIDSVAASDTEGGAIEAAQGPRTTVVARLDMAASMAGAALRIEIVTSEMTAPVQGAGPALASINLFESFRSESLARDIAAALAPPVETEGFDDTPMMMAYCCICAGCGSSTAFNPAAAGASAYDENGTSTTTSFFVLTGIAGVDGLLSGIGWAGGTISYSDPDAASDYGTGYFSDSNNNDSAAGRTPKLFQPASQLPEERTELPHFAQHLHRTWPPRTRGASPEPWHIGSLQGDARSNHARR